MVEGVGEVDGALQDLVGELADGRGVGHLRARGRGDDAADEQRQQETGV